MFTKKTVFLGVFWNIANAIILKGSVFFVTIYLANILEPKDFGIIGMISIFFILGNSLLDSGLSQSLIRTLNPNQLDYSTVFFTNIIIAFIVYGIFYIIAPFVADFYNQSILTSLIRVYCITFIFSSFSAVHIAILNKKMAFKKIALFDLPSYVIGCFIGIVLAKNNFGVWSLVYMQISIKLINAIVLWLGNSWRPKMYFSIIHFKKHYSFGYKLMISEVIDNVFNNLYNIVIGKLYNPVQLGYFERSNALKTYPVTTLSDVIYKITLPLLSVMQEDTTKLLIVYRKILKISFFIVAPIMIGLAVVAQPLFNLILGSKWEPAIIYFQILCLSSVFYPVHAFNVNIFKVLGRSDLFLKLVIIKKTLLIIVLLISIFFGITGLLWGGLFVSIISLFLNSYYNKSLIMYSLFDQFKDLFPTLFCTSLMGLTTLYFVENIFTGMEITKLCLGISFGFIIYLISSVLLNKSVLINLFQLVKK